MDNSKIISGLHDFTMPFWEMVKDVWNHGLFGVDIGSIIIALLIFGFFLLIRQFIVKFTLRRLTAWAMKNQSAVFERILPSITPPLKFVPVIMGVFFAGQYLEFSKNMEFIFDKAMRSLIAFNIFWAIFLATEPLSQSFKKLERMLSSMMTQWVFKVLKIMVVFIGGAAILEIWGIKVAPLLAGLGLFGAAIALGAQDFFKNLIAGMSIISEKRFQPGDWILVDGVVEGTVEEISFRSTRIRRFDKAPIYVPNSKLADAVVTNFSRMTFRRIRWTIGLKYSTTTAQLKTVCDGIKSYILENEKIFSSPEEAPTTVNVDSFNDSSIDILVNCFTRTIDFDEWMKIKEGLAFKIKELVEDKAKAAFAFPSRTVFVENTNERNTKTV
ncbi:MAG: mechanosensitive ion channel family protein [Alphaproteobacteria bacterium]